MYVVLLSGPPHCGKDSIANLLQTVIEGSSLVPCFVEHPAKTIRECGMTLLGAPNTDDVYEELKRTPLPLFTRVRDGGQDNFREFMIGLMEEYLRPKYGVDFLSRIVKAQYGEWWRRPAVLVLPSIGFQEEADFYIQEIGTQDVLSVRVSRQGCSFAEENDSRNYVDAYRQLDLSNDGPLLDTVTELATHMRSLGWTF